MIWIFYCCLCFWYCLPFVCGWAYCCTYFDFPNPSLLLCCSARSILLQLTRGSRVRPVHRWRARLPTLRAQHPPRDPQGRGRTGGRGQVQASRRQLLGDFQPSRSTSVTFRPSRLPSPTTPGGERSSYGQPTVLTLTLNYDWDLRFIYLSHSVLYLE